MDKREQVFVSSTYTDLAEERQSVIQTLLEADCIPAGMELFPASNEERWELIRRVIDGCDYYVVIVGGRYGSVDSDGISYTEREFDYAEECSIPILGFVHGSPDSIAISKSDIELAARDKLETFVEKVKQRMCKTWHTPDELGAQVAKSLIQVRKLYPAEGWVRATDATPLETRAELAELRERVAELELELAAREEARAGAEGLAQGADPQTLSGTFVFQDGTRAYEKVDSFDVSWDHIFEELGPHMFEECRQARLEEVLNEYVGLMAFDEVDRPTTAPEDAVIDAFKVADWSFNGVIIQLFALGLIQGWNASSRSTRSQHLLDYDEAWT